MDIHYIMNVIKVLKFILALLKASPRIFIMTVVLPLVAWFKARKAGTPKRVHQIWSNSISKYLDVQYEKVGEGSRTEEDVIFLCNHRTQADFFISDHVTGYKANILARKEVAYVFPMAWVTNPGSVWFFNRSKIDIEKYASANERFNKWLDQMFAKSYRRSLLVFPEGHRMYKTSEVRQIKSGMIKYSYMRKKPVQIVMTFGNEEVFNQRQMKISFGKKVYYSFSEVIDPNKYGTQEQYVTYVSDRFKAFFAENYQIYQRKLAEESQAKIKSA